MLSLLSFPFKHFLFLSLLFSFLAGLINFWILYSLVSFAVTVGDAPWQLLQIIVLSFLYISTSAFAVRFGAETTNRATVFLRSTAAEKIASLDTRAAESAPRGERIRVLIDDCSKIGEAIGQLPSVAINITIVCSILIYLSLLSVLAGVVLAILLSLGLIFAASWNSRIADASRDVVDMRGEVYESSRFVVNAHKELKLSSALRDQYLKVGYGGILEKFRRANVKLMTSFGMFSNTMSAIFYIGLALAVFAASIHKVEGNAVTLLIPYFLFALGPIGQLVGSLNIFRLAVSAYESANLFLSQTIPEPSLGHIKADQRLENTIRLKHLLFSYQGHDSPEEMLIGPISAEFSVGELHFITGLNGSGKTTCLKLICGLYSPRSGQIECGSALFNHDNPIKYLDNFSCVFSDFQLFDTLGIPDVDPPSFLTDLIALCEIEEFMDAENYRILKRDVSQGQLKRIALVDAVAKKRPFLILDEWAAEQDPSFRSTFYLQVIPMLLQKSIGIVMVTHDKDYFNLADRLYSLDINGKFNAASEVSA